MMQRVDVRHTPKMAEFSELAAPAAPPRPTPAKPAPVKPKPDIKPAPQIPVPEPRLPVRPNRSPDPATHPCTQPGPSTCPAP